VAGTVNRSAHRAVLQVLRGGYDRFNPLVVFGGSGMGKTHLLRGLVIGARQAGGVAAVHYASGDDFASAFRSSLVQRKVKRFRSYFRSLDLLALDDLQAFSGKRRVQEEFLHTFDALVNRGGRVVVATASHPRDIPALEDRLRQRLAGGLLVRLREPDFGTRLSIVRGESVRMNHTLCEEVMNFLARHVRRNVRELIGAVTRLSAYAALEGGTIGLEEAQRLLVDHLETDRTDDLPPRIVQAVCEAYRISAEELRGRCRRRRVVRARKLACHLLRAHGSLSLREIGGLLGGRKASTVRAAVRDVERELAAGGEVAEQIRELQRALGLGNPGSG
jgi:chromosomal replication initiator protein